MFQVIVPVFLIILVGFFFGKKNRYAPEAERLINDYALYAALPAFLFLAIAQTDRSELMHWGYVGAAFIGIAIPYAAALLLSKALGVPAPKSSLIALASCFGNTGYMGIPIITATLGHEAAAPASIIWIVHNIPAMMAVIITHDACDGKKRNILLIVARALWVTLKNPLTLAVLAGITFSALRAPMPDFVASFTRMLGAAAGPTALFALGLGMAGTSLSADKMKTMAKSVLPVVFLKMFFQPAVTFAALLLLFGFAPGVWFMSTLIMSCLPVGAVAYIFASRYGFFREEASVAIVISQLLSVLTLSLVLYGWERLAQ